MAMTRGSRTEVVDVIYIYTHYHCHEHHQHLCYASSSASLRFARGGCTYLPRSSFGDDNGDIIHGWYWRGLADGEGE